jgi:hypothetical protein
VVLAGGDGGLGCLPRSMNSPRRISGMPGIIGRRQPMIPRTIRMVPTTFARIYLFLFFFRKARILVTASLRLSMLEA